MNSTEAVHQLVISGDVCGSGRLGMRGKLRMREAMYEAVHGAFERVGVRGGLHLEDRGDGVLAALPPQTPPSLMAGLWVDELHQRLRQGNEGRAEPLRMRVAMHAGPVSHDGRGLVGRAVDLACRLCDSDVAKRTMERAQGVPLLLVVSDSFYRDVVAEGGRYIEPEHYRRARVTAKETDEAAWFHVPRMSVPPLPPDTPGGRPGEAGGRAGGGPSAEGEGADRGADRGRSREAGRGERPERNAPDVKYLFEHIGGDNLVVEGNTVHGGFTGIRKEYRAGTGEGSGDE
ncbi:hypothetical protein [Streptomyces macrosporus]|uniref:hypothetical protein n=1 Tax=Streptomyces macrosporus TaxID=44032 RepID=UPI0031CE5A0D